MIGTILLRKAVLHKSLLTFLNQPDAANKKKKKKKRWIFCKWTDESFDSHKWTRMGRDGLYSIFRLLQSWLCTLQTLSFIFSSTCKKHAHLLVCQMGVFPTCNMHVNFNSKTSYQRLHLVVQVLLLALPFLWVQVTEPLMRTQKQIEEVRCWGAMATKQRQRQTGQLCERGAMRKRDNARGR